MMCKFSIAAMMAILLVCGGTASAEDPDGFTDVEREHVARFQINRVDYLIEVGKYLEALEAYQTALEFTRRDATRTEALLGKAFLLATYLDAYEDALKVYREVAEKYPEGAETAIYREGLLLFDRRDLEEARRVLEGYLKKYPQGRFRFQSEALLEQIEREMGEKPLVEPPPVEVTKLPPPEPPPWPPKQPTEGYEPTTVVTGADKDNPVMRVRMCRKSSQITLSGSSICTEGGGCGSEMRVTLAGGSVAVNGKSLNSREAVFTGGPIKVSCGSGSKRVRGNMRVFINEGSLRAVNYVDMEDYLRGVVPAESMASWPIDTLKAQAIAARTYAYYQKLHRQNWTYDVVDYAGDQAYEGVDREHPRSDRAVKETEGMILVHDNKPILAMYTANSGGYCGESKAIFDLYKAYLIAHPDSESMKGQMATWTRKFSSAEVEKGLRNRLGLDISNLSRIEGEVLGPSGRMVKARIHYAGGSKVIRTRTTLRSALNLPDILIKVEKRGDTFHFEGHGFGHGVGYSQWGGAALGKQKDFASIVAFYYPDTRLERWW